MNNSVLDQLARTKGWTLFVGILCWILAALLLVGALAMFAFGLIGGVSGLTALPDAPAGAIELNPLMGGPMGSALGGLVMGGIYLAMALVYVYPAIKLCRFSHLVGQLLGSPSEQGLAEALNEQRAFWKYVGIMIIAMIILYLLIFIGAIVFAGIVAANVSPQ